MKAVFLAHLCFLSKVLYAGAAATGVTFHMHWHCCGMHLHNRGVSGMLVLALMRPVTSGNTC
jgi:hypothetical protein